LELYLFLLKTSRQVRRPIELSALCATRLVLGCLRLAVVAELLTLMLIMDQVTDEGTLTFNAQLSAKNTHIHRFHTLLVRQLVVSRIRTDVSIIEHC